MVDGAASPTASFVLLQMAHARMGHKTHLREKSETGGNQPPDSVDTEPHSGSSRGPFHSQDPWIVSLLLLSAFSTKVLKAYLESTLVSHTTLHSYFLEYTGVCSLL